MGRVDTVSIQYNTSNDQQSLGVADAIEASDMILVILRDDHPHIVLASDIMDMIDEKSKNLFVAYAAKGNSQAFIQERGTASILVRDGERSEVPNE